ncbi:exopolygalacturonase-like [Punica granatum]|uniref:Exopolygalacturonase-like n=1 Tax=Punica granatum TaxID=22663 RepID=A0A6P8DM27_PUNGR|nr:exopolygalacturonase-like [Punica granatum]
MALADHPLAPAPSPSVNHHRAVPTPAPSQSVGHHGTVPTPAPGPSVNHHGTIPASAASPSVDHHGTVPAPSPSLNVLAPSPSPSINHHGIVPAPSPSPSVNHHGAVPAPSPSPSPSISHHGNVSAPAPSPSVVHHRTVPTPAPSPSVDHHGPGPAPTPQGGIFDVEDYGAVGDGKTDSTTAFSSAWEEACSHPGESAVFIPAGTFFVGHLILQGPCHKGESPKLFWMDKERKPGAKSVVNTAGATAFPRFHGFFGQTLKFNNVSGGTINNMALLNSKGFHIGLYRSNNIHVYNVNITAPGDSPNTDGIHVSHSKNISISSSRIGVGDDCVSIGPGSNNITVTDIECGPGHGISVGSLGKNDHEENVAMIKISNCKISGTQNGARVKTWPGSSRSIASSIVFEDIIMDNVSNPIIIDQEYCPSGTCKTHKPSQVKISNLLFKNISGTYTSKYAVSLLCSRAVACENISLFNIDLSSNSSETARTGGLNIEGSIESLEIFNSDF